jgi:hypothetical protein
VPYRRLRDIRAAYGRLTIVTDDHQDSIPKPDFGQVPASIGRVAIHAARVEHVAGILAVTLIGTERAAPVVMGSGWSSTKQALLVLLDERAARFDHGDRDDELEIEVCRKMQTLVRRADALMQDRSHVVHALWDWTAEDETAARTAMLIRKWGREKQSDWTINRIDKLADDLHAIDTELMEWIGSL